MSDPTCHTFRELLGVYVVGAIEPSERSLLDAHLNQCYGCREELAGLAVLPALLHRIPVDEAEEIARSDQAGLELNDPAPQVLGGLLAEVGARRRKRRARTVFAVAAAVIVAVGGGAVVSAATGSAGHQQIAASRFEQASAVRGPLSATVRYDGSHLGTAMWVRVRGVPEWTLCKFWVTTADGQSELVGGWLVGSGGDGLWYQTWSTVHPANVTGFVLTAAGKVLLRIPAD
jgi:Putative zinc-finger